MKQYDESKFILGIDIGDSTSSICYFDQNKKHPEIIDLSGGYGKASVPTIMQYISDTREWVFGEYAVLNTESQNAFNVKSLMDGLGKNQTVDICGRTMMLYEVLSIYLKELIGSCKNINPNIEISKILVSVSNYFSKEAKEEFLKSFNIAGFRREIIEFRSEKECILAKYYFNKKIHKDRIMVLDFSNRELRGGVYDISENSIKTLSYMFDKTISMKIVDEKIADMFTSFFKENSKISVDEQVKYQIEAFSYQHKDLLFQKNILNRAVKLYFNFAYPPFAIDFTKRDLEKFIAPFKEKFCDFFDKLLCGKTTLEILDKSDITTILLTGGGFEMPWAKRFISDIFPDSNIVSFKNAKLAFSEGASIIAASEVGVISRKKLEIIDDVQIKEDIGILANKQFEPIIKRDTFWFDANKNLKVIVNETTNGFKKLDILKRDYFGETKVIGEMRLDNLPKRPKGTTQISINMSYESLNTLKVAIYDYGFGELFEKSDAKTTSYLKITG